MPWRQLVSRRRLEWWLSSFTAVVGAFIMLWPRALDSFYYEVAKDWAIQTVWGCSLLICALFHVWALTLNGRRYWSPYVRLVACGALCVIYTVLFATVFTTALHRDIGELNMVVLLHAGPAWASICAFWVAATDTCRVSRGVP